jgi:hypothetical protein
MSSPISCVTPAVTVWTDDDTELVALRTRPENVPPRWSKLEGE